MKPDEETIRFGDVVSSPSGERLMFVGFAETGDNEGQHWIGVSFNSARTASRGNPVGPFRGLGAMLNLRVPFWELVDAREDR